jgi:hypothetical protein
MFGLSFCLESEVEIQWASARRGSRRGPETARAGNGRRAGHSGPEVGILAPGHGTGLSRFRHPRVSVCGPASPDAPVAPDATRIALECKERRRVVGSVGWVPVENRSLGFVLTAAPDNLIRHCVGDYVRCGGGCLLECLRRQVCVPLRHDW